MVASARTGTSTFTRGDGPRRCTGSSVPFTATAPPPSLFASAARSADVASGCTVDASTNEGRECASSSTEMGPAGMLWIAVDACGADAAVGRVPDAPVRGPESDMLPDAMGGSDTTPSNAARSFSASSRAEPKRAAGSRAQACANQASTLGGSAGLVADGLGASVVAIFTASAPKDGPSYGRCPVSASKATTASDQRSLRRSMIFCAVTCSGLM